MQFRPDNSDCKLYVRRTGILAAVGHDLELCVHEYRVDVALVGDRSAPVRDFAGATVRAEFEACSVRVVDAVDSALRRRAGALSAHDKSQIDATIADEILKVARYPSIVFESMAIEPAPNRYRVRGQLTLTGQTRAIELLVLLLGNELRVDFAIHQPDFAIAPFRALGGALRLAPDVRLAFSARDVTDLLALP